MNIAFDILVTVSNPFKEDGSRQLNKSPCYFCSKQILHFTRHLRDSHSNEMRMCSIWSLEKKSQQMEIEKLRFEATFNYNCSILESDKGEIIVRRRSVVPRPAEDYLPCIHCLAFYVLDELWRHVKKCPYGLSVVDSSDEVKLNRGVISAAQMLIDGGKMNQSGLTPEFRKDVLSHMKRDEITFLVKNDPLIIKYGAVQHRKYGLYRMRDIISRMRQLGKLLKVINETQDPNLLLTNCLGGTNYDSVVSAVEILCRPETGVNGINTFGTPSIGLKLGHSLLKCALIKKGTSIRQKDLEMGVEADSFVSLFKAEYTETISSRCHVSFRLRKINKVDALPLTSDLVKLNDYLASEIKNLVDELKRTFSYSSWRNLMEMVLIALIIFNKRRGGEISRLLLSTFTQRPNWAENQNAEIFSILTTLEKLLLKRYLFSILVS